MTTSKKLNILCTGGAGLIGASVVANLNAQGQTDIVIVDRLGKTDKWKNLVGLRYREYLEVDAFRARRQLTSCDFDIVIALGACSSTTETNASYLAENNLADMIEMCQWTLAGSPYRDSGFLKSRRMVPRFIYASSAATFGDGSVHMSDAGDLDTLRPLNAYGWSKHAFDQWAARQGLLDKIVGLKYFNIIGPGGNHKGDMQSVVAKGYDEITRTGQLTLFDMPKDKPVGRDFLYVKDAAAITTFFALDDKGRQANGLFNVGSGVASTWDELAESLFAALDRSTILRTIRGAEDQPIDISAIRRIPMPAHLKGKYQYYTKADISRLRGAGYSAPIMPLKDAIKDYVTNHLIPDRRIA